MFLPRVYCYFVIILFYHGHRYACRLKNKKRILKRVWCGVWPEINRTQEGARLQWKIILVFYCRPLSDTYLLTPVKTIYEIRSCVRSMRRVVWESASELFSLVLSRTWNFRGLVILVDCVDSLGLMTRAILYTIIIMHNTPIGRENDIMT